MITIYHYLISADLLNRLKLRILDLGSKNLGTCDLNPSDLRIDQCLRRQSQLIACGFIFLKQ